MFAENKTAETWQPQYVVERWKQCTSEVAVAFS
jgi:hypothetical protein